MQNTAEAWNAFLRQQQRVLLDLLSRGSPLNLVLHSLLISMEQRGNQQMRCSVLLTSADGTRLLSCAAPSLPSDYCAAINGILIGPSVGSCGTAAYCRHAIYVSDIATHPFWEAFKAHALKANLSACWSVPLLGSGNQTLGTLAMYYTEKRAPSAQERAEIEAAAMTAELLIQYSGNHRAVVT